MEKQNQDKQKEQKYKKEILLLTYLFAALFVLLIGNISYFLIFQSGKVINNAYNKRQDLFAREVLRGKILSQDGKVLAYSEETEQEADTRIYPYHELFCHIVGRAFNGKSGIENQMNFNLLTSHDDPWKRFFEKLRKEKNMGDNVVTTLNVDLQKAASEAIGARKGAIVVIEPDTGKVIAMVSKPDYDPNEIAQNWDKITAEDNTNHALLNRATQGLYPPGSTFKILTTLEYIREHPNTYQDIRYQCEGKFQYGEYRVNCYKNKKHGTIDIRSAFAKSCNSFFAKLGTELNWDRFQELSHQLLFHVFLPTKLANQKSSFMMDGQGNANEAMQTAIGQGKTQMTPLHVALITAAIANDGILMKPYVVDRIETYDGAVVKKYWPEIYGELIKPEEAELLKDFMKAAVTEGTASKLNGKTYQAYGKTGTAEYIAESGKMEAHAWFTGFAQKDGKQIAISVIVEGAGAGSEYAVPIAQKVFDQFY